MPKKVKRSIRNNLNRNAEAVLLRFFCNKGALKNVVIVTRKHRARVSLLIKLHASRLQFIKKETPAKTCTYCWYWRKILTPLKCEHVHKQRRKTTFSVTKEISRYSFDRPTEEFTELWKTITLFLLIFRPTFLYDY